jgi:hypothetical protein
MTEQDIYRQFEESYAIFDKEGITPANAECVERIFKTASEAGFSADEIAAIHAQVLIKSEAADDPEFRNLQQSMEKRFRFVAQRMIRDGKSMEDFLALIDKAFDHTVEKVRLIKPTLDDLEISVKRAMDQETAKKIWTEETLRQ